MVSYLDLSFGSRNTCVTSPNEMKSGTTTPLVTLQPTNDEEEAAAPIEEEEAAPFGSDVWSKNFL